MEYRLFAVRVFVTDWERALRFYGETLGMAISYRNDEAGWAQMAPGAGPLARERAEPSDEGRALVGRFVGVSRQVPNILVTHRELVERGVELVAGDGEG